MNTKMYILAVFIAALVHAEESSEEMRVNGSSFVDDNDLRPFEDNKRPLVTDWLTVKNKDVDKEIHLVEGQALILTCEASGSPMPQVGWFKDNTQITEEITEENEIKPFGVIRIIQRFISPCVTLLHSGYYYCKGINGDIKAETEVTKVVVHRTRPGTGGCKISRGKARLTMFTPVMMQVMGLDVTIPCRATGVPTPMITWTHDNHLIKDKRIKVLENGDLYIPKLRWLDMGGYRCVATNQFGSDSHMTFLYPLLKEQ